MKIASLPSLFFLLFAFFSTTQTLTLAATDDVKDIEGKALVPGEKYHILDASNHDNGIQTEQVNKQTCPVSVILGIDPKKVIFHTEDEHQDTIKIGDVLHIEFAQVSGCAKSANWTVEIHGNKKYPVLIGPPEGVQSMDGKFHIKKSQKMADAYNIAFSLHEAVEYSLAAIPYAHNKDIMRVEFCEEAYDVVFKRYQKSVPTPASLPSSSNFVPYIRKIVR